MHENLLILKNMKVKAVLFELNNEDYENTKQEIENMMKDSISVILGKPVTNKDYFTLTVYGIKATFSLK